MGPVRHRNLIRVLALVVSLELLVGAAVLYTRGGPASAADPKARTPRAAGRAPDGTFGVGAAPGEILAGVDFNDRRGSGKDSSGRANPGSAAAAVPSPGSSPTSVQPPPTTAPSSSTSLTRGTSPTTMRAPTTTTTPAATSTTGRALTTSTTAAPANGGAQGGPSPSGGGATPPTTRPAAPDVTWVAVEDAAGDTVVDGTNAPKAEGRADIVRARATYTATSIVLAMESGQKNDPLQDPHWASSSTFLHWELDTNDDGQPDFDIQFFLDEGTPVAGVSRVGDNDSDSVCEAEAGYWTDSYAVGFDPACLGSPATFSYRVSMYYDTDPSNEDAEVITDITPNGGYSRPVARKTS